MQIADYNPSAIEPKWQKIWDETGAFRALDDHTMPKYYCLIEFPYPSGAGLHVGHPRSNTALDIIESENRNRSKLVSIDDGKAQNMAIENIGDGADSALETIIETEDKDSILAFIEGLPELYREVARRRMVEGESYKEISEHLDMSLNTVRTRIRRAKQLMDKMRDNSEDEK